LVDKFVILIIFICSYLLFICTSAELAYGSEYVFKLNSGATIAKSCNRVGATFLAGSVGLGVHWIANLCGQELEPVILQVSVFILGE